MNQSNKIFTRKLFSWYEKNKRDLPWRRTKDPYVIWISEIILQQTRIEQGLPYFYRFLKNFPTVQKLANAREEEVLKIWQGLGYYSRARNMHSAANTILNDFNGEFPGTFERIKKLKGVGNYTAAAIASMAFKQPVPVVDGNVLRFFSRLFGVSSPVDKEEGKQLIHKIALKYLDKADPGTFNQAVMEFGALQCKPLNPVCSACIFVQECHAFKHNLVKSLPRKSGVINQTQRYFHYFLNISREGEKLVYIHLRKRDADDIWKNLYDLPLIESDQPVSIPKLKLTTEWEKIFGTREVTFYKITKPVKHVLSHQLIFTRFYFIDDQLEQLPGCIRVKLDEIQNYPIPRLIERFLVNEGILNST